jgi:hypothetical protein
MTTIERHARHEAAASVMRFCPSMSAGYHRACTDNNPSVNVHYKVKIRGEASGDRVAWGVTDREL